MNVKPYPKYKPSGVDWIGNVPDHWRSVALKWISRRYTGGTPDKSNQDYWSDGTIPWLNSGAVNDSYIKEPSTFITEDAFLNSSAKWIPQGALVLALAGQGKTKGMVAQVGFSTTCNQSMAAIIPSSTYSSRFLVWWLHRNYDILRNLAGGDARDGLNLEMIGMVPCPLLPLPEQQAIATFLDRETGRIDTLIEKKHQLIEFLKEKRSALISQAVTKGLDTSVKFKPSNVEWIGEVPLHWKIGRLKYTATLKSGENITSDDINVADLYPVYGGNGLRGYTATFTHDGSYVLIGRQGALCGNINYASGRFWASEHAVVVSPIAPVATVWLGELLRMMNLNQYSLSAAQPGLAVDRIKELQICIPPFKEQQAIAAFLDQEAGKIDSLIAAVEAAIEKLQEYRTAIISEAVTGKIDVREAI